MVTAQAANADCAQTLKDCDAAVKASQTLVNDLYGQIDNYKAQSTLQQQIISDQAKELDSPFKDPVKVGLGTTLLVLIGLGLSGHLK